MKKGFRPKILVFCCDWCAYAGADMAGVKRVSMEPDFVVLRASCAAQIDPEHIMAAFGIVFADRPGFIGILAQPAGIFKPDRVNYVVGQAVAVDIQRLGAQRTPKLFAGANRMPDPCRIVVSFIPICRKRLPSGQGYIQVPVPVVIRQSDTARAVAIAV